MSLFLLLHRWAAVEEFEFCLAYQHGGEYQHKAGQLAHGELLVVEDHGYQRPEHALEREQYGRGLRGGVLLAYGLQQVAIMGISPDAEPTPADLKNLISTIKDNQVKYVFFETLVSPRIAQTVAEASGAETLVLDPLEGLSEAGRKNGDDYLKIMTRNIDNLELALGVK